MSPTSQNQQPAPDSQGLPVLTEKIDEANIISAEAVERPSSDGALEAYEASKLNAPVAPDLNSSEYKVTRSREDAVTPTNNGISRGRQVLAGVAAVATLSPVGVALMPNGSESVVTTNATTEQVQPEKLDLAPTEVSVPNEEVEAPTNLGEPVESNTSESEIMPEKVESVVDTDESVNSTSENNSDSTIPVADTITSVPEGIQQEVAGAEQDPGDITVSRSADLAAFLINNQDITGVDPTIEVNGESAIFTFNDPTGNSVIFSGRFDSERGTLILNEKLQMKDLFTITIIDAKGNVVSVKNSNDKSRKPGVSVAEVGQEPITTDIVLFPEFTLNAQKAADRAAQISADVEGYLRKPR